MYAFPHKKKLEGVYYAYEIAHQHFLYTTKYHFEFFLGGKTPYPLLYRPNQFILYARFQKTLVLDQTRFEKQRPRFNKT